MGLFCPYRARKEQETAGPAVLVGHFDPSRPAQSADLRTSTVSFRMRSGLLTRSLQRARSGEADLDAACSELLASRGPKGACKQLKRYHVLPRRHSGYSDTVVVLHSA